MKKILAFIAAAAIAVSSHAALVSFNNTNAQQQLDTNVFWLNPITSPSRSASGQWTTRGPAVRVTPDKNTGYATNRLAQGFWVMTNAFIGQPVVFNVPDDGGPTVYNVWDLWESGGFIFVTRIVSGGTNGPVTSNQVYNAIGYAPVSPSLATNIAAASGRLPDGRTAYTNSTGTFSVDTNLFVGTNDYVTGSNNIVQLIRDSTNGSSAAWLASDLSFSNSMRAQWQFGTNFTGTNTQDKINITSNGIVAQIQSNGGASTNYVNGYVQTSTNASESRSSSLIATTSNSLFSATVAATNVSETRLRLVIQASTNRFAPNRYDTNTDGTLIDAEGLMSNTVASSLSSSVSNFVRNQSTNAAIAVFVANAIAADEDTIVTNLDGSTFRVNTNVVASVTSLNNASNSIVAQAVVMTNGLRIIEDAKILATSNSIIAQAAGGFVPTNNTAATASSNAASVYYGRANLINPLFLNGSFSLANTYSDFVNSTNVWTQGFYPDGQSIQFVYLPGARVGGVIKTNGFADPNGDIYLSTAYTNRFRTQTNTLPEYSSNSASMYYGNATLLNPSFIGNSMFSMARSSADLAALTNTWVQIFAADSQSIEFFHFTNGVIGGNIGGYIRTNGFADPAGALYLSSAQSNQFVGRGETNTITLFNQSNDFSAAVYRVGSAFTFRVETNKYFLDGWSEEPSNNVTFVWMPSLNVFSNAITGVVIRSNNPVVNVVTPDGAVQASAPSLIGSWSQVSGHGAPTNSGYGSKFKLGGVDIEGDLVSASTNLQEALGRTRGNGLATNGNGGFVTNHITDPIQRIWNVKDFGVTGDGRVVKRVNIQSGSAVLTSAVPAFVSGDVGKIISVYGASSNHLNLTTTIATFTSSTSVSLNLGASTNCTNVSCVLGTDDTFGIQTAINYVSTNSGGGGTIYFPVNGTNGCGVYIVAGELQDASTGSWTNHHFAQITFPDIPQKLFGASVTLEGAYRVGSAGQPSPGYPDIDAVGSVIWSVYQRGPDTNLARVFDCRNFTTPATTGSSGAEQYPVGSPFQVSLNTLRAGFKNISIYHAFDNNMIVLDLSGAETCDLEGVWVDNGLRPPVYEDHVFTGTNGWSIWFPATFNENICRFDRSEVRGSFNGLDGGTSVIGANNNIQGCVRAWTFYTGGGNPIVMTGLHITSCLYYFYNPVGDGIPMFISGLSCENSIGGWWSSPSMFYDPFATISGEISFVGNPVQITVTNRVRLSHYMIGADNPVRDAYQLSPFVVSNSITAVHMKLSPLTGNNSGNIAELSWSTNSLLIPSNQRTMYFDGANWVFVNNDTSTEYWRISAAHAMTFGGSSYTFGSGTINHSGTFFGDGWSAAGGVLAANTSVGTAANAVPKIFGTTIVVTNLTMTTTSTAPTSVTVGVTAPDFWLVVTNNGLQLKVPAWTNH